MKERLHILWTNDNPITSEKMVFMYAHNAILNHWWDEVIIIIWGSTVQYVANEKQVQDRLMHIQSDGVKLSVCKACADQLGATQTIEKLGIELKYWGEPLTKLLKENEKIITI